MTLSYLFHLYEMPDLVDHAPDLRSIVLDELRRIGLPEKADGQLFFVVWELNSSGQLLALGQYSRRIGLDIERCEAIVVIDKNSKLVVLRTLPFTKENVDVPEATSWSPIDLADADGDGQVDIVLGGDSYENHWLEVVSLRGGIPQTIFSGLGYYL